MDNKVIIDKEVFNQMVNTLATMPYAQVAGLLQQVSTSMQELNAPAEEPQE